MPLLANGKHLPQIEDRPGTCVHRRVIAALIPVHFLSCGHTYPFLSTGPPCCSGWAPRSLRALTPWRGFLAAGQSPRDCVLARLTGSHRSPIRTRAVPFTNSNASSRCREFRIYRSCRYSRRVVSSPGESMKRRPHSGAHIRHSESWFAV